MTPRSWGENASSLGEEVYDEAVGVIPKKMTNPKPTDYAAIIRAAAVGDERKHPEWLDPGQQLFSPKYGQGKVMSWVGNTLIVKYPGYSIPVQYKNWQQAVEKSEIAPGNVPTTPESSSQAEENGAGEVQPASFSQVSAAEIAAIPQPKFRAIAQELASHLSAVGITPPKPGSLYAIPTDLPFVLQNALRGLGIHKLYSHQIEALDCLRKGCDLSIVTPTASGKTLCYNLAILEDCLNRPQTSALYIFPLKALAFDQFRLPAAHCRNISPRTAGKSGTNDRRYSLHRTFETLCASSPQYFSGQSRLAALSIIQDSARLAMGTMARIFAAVAVGSY